MNHILITLFVGMCGMVAPLSSLSVLIIGGGPAGLSAALEAHMAGAKVTLIEKCAMKTTTDSLIRSNRFLFLSDTTLSQKS